MALKFGSPTSYRQQITSAKRLGVGETYGERFAKEKRAQQVDAPATGLFGKIKDFFAGSKTPAIQQFGSNAEYVNSANTIAAVHRNLEQGVKTVSSPADNDLFAILNHVEKVCK